MLKPAAVDMFFFLLTFFTQRLHEFVYHCLTLHGKPPFKSRGVTSNSSVVANVMFLHTRQAAPNSYLPRVRSTQTSCYRSINVRLFFFFELAASCCQSPFVLNQHVLECAHVVKTSQSCLVVPSGWTRQRLYPWLLFQRKKPCKRGLISPCSLFYFCPKPFTFFPPNGKPEPPRSNSLLLLRLLPLTLERTLVQGSGQNLPELDLSLCLVSCS